MAQAVSKNKNAIGYLGIGYVDKSVKALTVNGIVGNEETTLNGKFPISRPLFMFTRGWPTGDALNFINYVLNPQKGPEVCQRGGICSLVLVSMRIWHRGFGFQFRMSDSGVFTKNAFSASEI